MASTIACLLTRSRAWAAPSPWSPASGDELGHITQSTDFNFNSTWIVAGSNNIKLYDGSNYTNVGVDLRSVRHPRFSGLDPKKWSSCQSGRSCISRASQFTRIFF